LLPNRTLEVPITLADARGHDALASAQVMGTSIMSSCVWIPAYYLVDIDHILGPAALFRCPVNPCIGPKGLDRVGRQNPSAEAETREGDGKGSPLYRLHMWYMRWGNTHEGMQMVRRFAEKEMDESSDY